MPNIDLSVNTGQTKQLTFNCANTYMPEDIVFNITASGGDVNTDYVIQCDTPAGTRLKSGTSVTSYTPSVGVHMIHIKNTNTYASTGLYGQFNGVPSNTVTPIYINGSQSMASNRTLPAGLYAAYYDGTRWRFRTDGKIDFGRTGFLKANGTIDTTAYTANTGTVTSVGLTNATNGGLTISGSPITSSGSITVGHSNVLSSAQSTQAVYPITIDKNGHIGSYGTAVTIPTISGTNDGTNWTSLTINGTTKNIPSGGSGSATYLSDLQDVYTDSGRTDEFLGFNGDIWTGMFAAKTVNAGSGLNTTSGDTTTDGGYIGFGATTNGSDASVPTGTLHLTRVNTASGYDNAKLSFGPTGNITVTSSSNTFTVPYYMVDKFGRVTSSKSRTITINGLGGGSSNVSATASEDTTLGYFAGSINIDGRDTNFVVSPARITELGVKLSRQGVVRPHYEIDTSEWSNTSYLELGSRLGSISSLNVASLDKTITKGCFLPITVIYRFNTTTQKYESIPGIIINSLENPFVGYSVDNTTIITS